MALRAVGAADGLGGLPLFGRETHRTRHKSHCQTGLVWPPVQLWETKMKLQGQAPDSPNSQIEHTDFSGRKMRATPDKPRCILRHAAAGTRLAVLEGHAAAGTRLAVLENPQAARVALRVTIVPLQVLIRSRSPKRIQDRLCHTQPLRPSRINNMLQCRCCNNADCLSICGKTSYTLTEVPTQRQPDRFRGLCVLLRGSPAVVDPRERVEYR